METSKNSCAFIIISQRLTRRDELARPMIYLDDPDSSSILLPFFAIPLAEMLLFALCFGGAVYFRRRPAEHKTLMLMTAINFLTPAFARIPLLPPEFKIAQAFGIPALLALACF